MVASSSSNLLLLAATHQQDAGYHHHGWNESTLPTDPDLLHLPTTNRRSRHGFLIRSHSHNNIRGSIGNLKDLIMLETVCAPPPPSPPVSAAAALTYSMKVPPPVPFHHEDNNNDDWRLGDDKEDDIITTTAHPTDDTVTITPPSTPGRKPRPIRSPQKEEDMLASIGVVEATKMMKDTSIRIPTLENCSSIGSSSSSLSSLSSMGSTNFKDIMLETATVLATPTISLFRSSASNSSPVPAPAPTPNVRNAIWSTNTSMKGLQSIYRFLSIPLTAPTMPDIFSCTGGGSTGTTTTTTTTSTTIGC